jgi:hypothetical protein
MTLQVLRWPRAARPIGSVAFGMALSMAFAMPTRAQTPNPGMAANAYAARAKENAGLMQKYTWKMRIQFVSKGEDKPAVLYQMNYSNGQLQKTLLTAPEKPGGRQHGIKHRMEEKKLAEFKQWVEDLTSLIKRYMTPSPGAVMDFYSKATFSPMPSGNVKATEMGFIQPGDTATYWVNPATHKPVQYTFTTSLEGDAVHCTVQFADIPHGPQYASTIHVSVPARQISATVTQFDYQLSQ